MKIFEDKNYYQILKVSPDAATGAIHHAYRDALALYDEDSLASYALFSDDQRKLIMAKLSEAYDTLRDDSKRTAYNQMLVDTGQVDAATYFTTDNTQPPAMPNEKGASRDQSLAAWVTRRSGDKEIKSIRDEIFSKDWVSGSDLKKLRTALGIEPQEIYEIARISGSMLQILEDSPVDDLPAEIYLKYFLRSLAEILQLDPQHIVKAYFNYMALAAK